MEIHVHKLGQLKVLKWSVCFGLLKPHIISHAPPGGSSFSHTFPPNDLIILHVVSVSIASIGPVPSSHAGFLTQVPT